MLVIHNDILTRPEVRPTYFLLHYTCEIADRETLRVKKCTTSWKVFDAGSKFSSTATRPCCKKGGTDDSWISSPVLSDRWGVPQKMCSSLR